MLSYRRETALQGAF